MNSDIAGQTAGTPLPGREFTRAGRNRVAEARAGTRPRLFFRRRATSELVVIAFDSPDEADRLLTKLDELERDSLIDLEDSVVAVRSRRGRVRLKQSITARRETRQGLISGALFGTLIGALLLDPLAGLAAGAAIGGATGALSGKLLDFEISDDFIRDVGRSLRPDSSALFLLVRRVKPDQLLEEIQGFGGHVIRSTLSSAQEARLGEALSRQPDSRQPAPVPA